MFAFLEGGEAIQWALVAAGKFIGPAVTIAPQIFFGPDTDHVLGFEEKTELVGQIEISLVVRRSRKEDALAGVAGDVVSHDRPAASFSVSQVVTFVNDDDAIATQVRQDVLGLGDRHDFRDQAVAMRVVFPHSDDILGTKNECFEGPRRILKHACQRRGHERFAEADDIAKDHATALFQMPRGDANGRRLKLKQDTTHICRDGKL